MSLMNHTIYYGTIRAIHPCPVLLCFLTTFSAWNQNTHTLTHLNGLPLPPSKCVISAVFMDRLCVSGWRLEYVLQTSLVSKLGRGRYTAVSFFLHRAVRTCYNVAAAAGTPPRIYYTFHHAQLHLPVIEILFVSQLSYVSFVLGHYSLAFLLYFHQSLVKRGYLCLLCSKYHCKVKVDLTYTSHN